VVKTRRFNVTIYLFFSGLRLLFFLNGVYQRVVVSCIIGGAYFRLRRVDSGSGGSGGLAFGGQYGKFFLARRALRKFAQMLHLLPTPRLFV